MKFNLSKGTTGSEPTYYLSVDDTTDGPYTIDEVIKNAKVGDLVWSEEIGKWTNIENVREFQGHFKKQSSMKNKRTILFTTILVGIAVASVGAFFAFKSYCFRAVEGELYVAINKLKMREFPDTESLEIGMFPFGTRLKIVDNNPVVDHKQRVWHKVEAIGDFGWYNSTTGWMVLKSVNVSWVLEDQDLRKVSDFIGNEEAQKKLGSKLRKALLRYFDRNSTLAPDWKVYLTADHVEDVLAIWLDLNLSAKDGNEKQQYSYAVIIQNKKEVAKKLVIFSFNERQEGIVEFELDCNEAFGLSKLARNKRLGIGQHPDFSISDSEGLIVSTTGLRKLIYNDGETGVKSIDIYE